MQTVLHLVDDRNPGGVTRYLDFIAADPAMSRLARHEIRHVSRSRPAATDLSGADVIVSHLAISWRGLPGLIALRARTADRRLIHVEHSYSAGFTAHNVRSRRRFRTLLKTAYALFDQVVAVSGTQGRWLERRGLVAPEALTVIPPCVDLAPFRALPRPEGPLRVLAAIGRFDRQKGFDLLLRAFREVPGPELRLHLIGDGPERARLEEIAAGDPRIVFKGFAEDVATALAGADAVAMPSRWEPYGLVALEAMAAGRPLLAAPVDGLCDHAAAGAIAVAEQTPAAWREAILALAEGRSAPVPLGRAAFAEAATAAGWRLLLAEVPAAELAEA
ncbi:glycosyltransferase [Poseidonocella sp. HB161398]|uniref:glycosyltransferase n=1 Tax=Poseidonocella sp. HB161398 TaxID=2320855 RepID=UPI00110902F6|nr:glycosyltransferase [Poseidonocella sp. HB161398]